jgi:hypothetical protein
MSEEVESGRELRLVLGFLVVFLLFNILTATSYPIPNVDEAMIAEPAINFLHGQGFHVRFSEILVVYPFLLVPWFELFGTSLRSLRSAGIVCTTAALLLLWSAVRRLDIVSRASSRLLLLLLLATEYGMIFAYRSGRYDGFGALLMAAILWAMSIEGRSGRLFSLCILCLILPWAGPQYMPLLFVAGVVLVILFRWRYWQEIAVSYLSSALGTAIFLAGVYACGRLSTFLAFTKSQQRSAGFISSLIRQGKLVHHNYIPKDLSFPFLFAAAIVLFVSLRQQKRVTSRSAVVWGIMFAAIFTGVLLAVAKFPTYYSYMIVIPVAVSVCSGLSVCDSVKAKRIVIAFCILSALAGAGLNLMAYESDREDHDYSRIQQFVSQSIHSDDIVYVEPVAYETTRDRARDAYFPNPDFEITELMTQQQKDSVTVVLVRSDWGGDITRALGGSWHETGENLAPAAQSIFDDRNLGFLTARFSGLRVYRRS